MKAKYSANWGVQIVGMIFQTRSSAMKITASIKKIDSPGAPSSSGIYALGTFGVGDIELYFDDIRTPCIKVNVECSYINYGFNNLSPRYIAPNQLYLDVDIVY